MTLRGTLRINNAPGLADAGNGGATQHDSYLGQLTKLFPVEVVSIYPAGIILLKAVEVKTWWFAWLCVVGIILFRSIATTSKDGGSAQYAAVGVALISFLLWVVVLGGWFLPNDAPPSEKTIAIATAVSLVWTWLAPLIVARFEPTATSGAAR